MFNFLGEEIYLRKIKGLIVLGLLLFLGVVFKLNVNADVVSQGTVFTDEEYQQLLESIPENAKLLSNDEYNAQERQRALTGLYHQSHIQDYGWEMF
ncbi:MAG: hypothetical protein LBS33_03540 [Streptococcaceae bacterium]|jgi:hypothetical protein|nr:hypothetical protein [Streptococcaceae bacterium]